MAIEFEREFIQVVADVGQPLGVLDHAIKVVANTVATRPIGRVTIRQKVGIQSLKCHACVIKT